jgi:hypothetical protein
MTEEEIKSQDESAPDKVVGDISPEEPPIPDPTFSHGVTLIANLNGEGFQIVPVDNGMQIRIATVDDIVGLLAMAQSHIQSNLTFSKIMNELNRKSQMAAEAKALNDRRSQQRR